MQTAAKRISADYFVPHLAHAMMEPESCTAVFADGACTVWTATQNPQQARATVAQVLGVRAVGRDGERHAARRRLRAEVEA